MKKICILCIIALITLVLSDFVQAVGIIEVTATQGKATDWRTPDTVMGNNTQLMTRNAANNDCKKSWLQFDLTSLYAENPSIQGNIIDAKLTFYGAKSESGSKSYAISGLNDAAGLEDWNAADLTWNNGPGNDTSSGNALNTSLTTSFYTATIDIPVLDVISETPEENRAALTEFLNTDSDGKITFIFTAGSTCYLWSVGQPLEPVLTLTYALGNDLNKAHNPIPADDAVVPSPASLSWTNPEPNIPGGDIFCDVYLGTEPNRAEMDVASLLTANVESAAINTTNFENYGNLQNNKFYYWAVDCKDGDELIEGEMWTFYVGQAPIANAGPDQVVWLGKSGTTGQEVVFLNGTTSDDGPYTIAWTQVDNGAPEVSISPNNIDDPSITITQRGDYKFQLTAAEIGTEGLLETSDTVRIVVGDDPCDASHIDSGALYNDADYNEDCIVNLADFVELIARDWLNCTDDLTHCAD